MLRECKANIIIMVAAAGIIILMFFTADFQGGKAANREGRLLAAFPNIRSETGINLKWVYDFENWLKDNLGLREKLIQINYQCRWKLFGMVEDQKYLVENNGWGFYIDAEDGNCISDYEGSNRYSEEEAEFIGKNIKKFVDAYKKLGYQEVYFIVTPSRMHVESEFVPDKYVRMHKEGRCEQICKYIKKEFGINVIYPKSSLIRFQSEQEKRVYYKYDIHWNRLGAYVAANELLNQMGKKQIQMEDCDIYQMQIQEPFGLATGLWVEKEIGEIPLDTYAGFRNGVVTNSIGKNQEEIINTDEDIYFTCTEPFIHLTALVAGDSNRLALTGFVPHIFSETRMMITGEKAKESLLDMQNKDILILIQDERYFPVSLNAYMPPCIQEYGVEYFHR
ncbi:MAG: hypothetical protein HFH33_12540 [Eubacterium sp.]|nr:hypothetical protein [Eubacterium sp.]